MSNTATVSPYSGSGSSVASAAGKALAAGTVGLISFLMEETEQDRKAVERLKEQRRQELLQGSRPVGLALRIKDTGQLIRAAQQLGYRLDTPLPTKSIARNTPPIVMRNSQGERLALRAGKAGTIVASDRSVQSIHAVVRQHTVDSVLRHLGDNCSGVKSRKLANGNVEIKAKELNNESKTGGTASIKAQVRVDGSMDVDIGCVKGSRCEQILSDLAKAAGGEPTRIEKKESYWQLPGESTKTKVGV